LNNLFHDWINWYNKTWINRDTGCSPDNRKTPSVFTPLPEETNLDDVFCLKDIRKIDRTNAFSYNGKIYTLNHQINLVGRKVTLHIHPERKFRVWHNDQFVEQLPW
jgi:hypothetical protein